MITYDPIHYDLDGAKYISRIGAMPNQIFGTLNGRRFYFRARHGSWVLRYVDTDPEELIAMGDHANAGWWDAATALAFCTAILAAYDNCPVTKGGS